MKRRLRSVVGAAAAALQKAIPKQLFLPLNDCEGINRERWWWCWYWQGETENAEADEMDFYENSTL